MVTKREPARRPPRRRPNGAKEESLWLRLAAIGESIPREEWEKLPQDLAKNFDHYAHGSPKQD